MKMIVVLIAASIMSQVALAESNVVCENDSFNSKGSTYSGGLTKAVDKLNARLLALGDAKISQVSAPAISVDSSNSYTVCVTITK